MLRLWGHWSVAAGIVAIWFASLALPAVGIRGGPTLTGLELLMQGWQGASRSVFAWYANPLFALALVLSLLRRRRAAGVVAGVCVVLALTSFAAEDLLRARMQSVPDIALRSGFFLWAGALIAFFVWSWTGEYRKLRN
jgi:hypothetical protein